MCLVLPGQAGRSIFVFKTYTHPALNSDGVIEVAAPYMGGVVKLRKGKPVCSNRRKTQLAQKELRQGYIDYGLHAFIYARDAAELAKSKGEALVVKMQAFAEDFVAMGYWSDSAAIVYRKLYPVEIVARYSNHVRIKNTEFKL